MNLNLTTYRLEGGEKIGRTFLWIGVVGLAAGFVGLFVQPDRFFRAYLIADVFWISLAIGGLFLVILHHLTGSVWSVVIRRIPEALMSVLPFMAVSFIPVLFGMKSLYPWTHHEIMESSHVLEAKAAFLNPGFFILRTVIYFTLLIWMAAALHRTSVSQDKNPDRDFLRAFRKISARAVVPFAFICAFASFDWLMSLDPTWYSTIFGVAFFCGAVTGALCAMTLTAIYLNRRGVLIKEITREHYYDMGKLIFAFVIMWTYMTFSQYLLIWYSNIPEEIAWYHHRSGAWLPVSLLIPFGWFLIPFIVLMSQSAKRNLTILTIIGLWLLVMHWGSLNWYVEPMFGSKATLSWMDLALTVGLGGLFLWRFWGRLTSQALIPVGDPHLQESVQFVSEY